MDTSNLKTKVIVHPLVLLSAADHYNRVAKDTKRRVVGVLLGKRQRYEKKNDQFDELSLSSSTVYETIDAINSFAVPFEEDLKNPNIWFLDHDYLENMYAMFKKVTSREEIIGFYSTGPKIKENDIKIAAMFEKYCEGTPIFVIIDVRMGVEGLPTIAYQPSNEITVDGSSAGVVQRVFKHVPVSIEAEEAEAVGVEHLLRDINDPSTSVLAMDIKQKVHSLRTGLLHHLSDITSYLSAVTSSPSSPPINQQIIYNLQDILNLLPSLNVDSLVNALVIKNNDISMVQYISSLIRAILALHDLLLNKIQYKDIHNFTLPSSTSVSTPVTTSATPGTPNPPAAPAAAL